MDEILICGKSLNLMRILLAALKKLVDVGLRLNKNVLLSVKVEFTGHGISEVGIQHLQDRNKAIPEAPGSKPHKIRLLHKCPTNKSLTVRSCLWVCTGDSGTLGLRPGLTVNHLFIRQAQDHDREHEAIIL